MRKIWYSLAGMTAVAALAVGTWAADKAESTGGVKIGAAVPAFTLQDQAGKPVSLADYAGKVVVLEWFNNECPFVQRHYESGSMNATAKKYSEKGVTWLAINSTHDKTDADNAAIAAKWSINRPILNDSTGKVGHLYGAKTTPDMFVIDKQGNLAYTGAIDDNAGGDKSTPTNYVAKALDEVLAGSPVTTPETKSYGCSVKYAN